MKVKTTSTFFLAAFLSFTATSAELQLDDGKLKAADLALRAQLSQRLTEIQANPEKYKDALYFGELRATLCKVCHGKDGNSVREGTPNLAGQNPVYIVDQFNRYADGRRLDYWMGSLAARFSDADKIKLAIFYSEQPTKPARGGNEQSIDKGKQIYQKYCVDCHGANARSTKGYARLAGQRPEYTMKMLKEFKSAKGKRFNPSMYARANMLTSDQDLEAVATYLAHLE